MKLTKISAIIISTLLLLSACTKTPEVTKETETTETKAELLTDSTTEILLSDSGIDITADSSTVYTANDIIYYEDGHDFTYGEGTEQDAHTREEAASHTVVHITKPGIYSLSGKLSLGQIAVDLGENAVDDPEAVVTLILNGVDITCEVAPAVIFYNVYECGKTDTESATKDVNTSAAGANVIIADDTVNNINGSYVERIYKPDSVILSDDGTEVADAKKLHKYDGAFYSKMSMNINGGESGTGILNIKAENEGLDSELHLTMNGGNINIESGNDGINTNEDGISVTTINGGALNIKVTGTTGEGDGIDSNGWLVINGGTVTAAACSFSADAGIDSDMGIHINGGTVIASGNMLDHIEANGQTYAVFNFTGKQESGSAITLKNSDGESIIEYTPVNSYSVLIFSSPDLTPGTYTLWDGENQLKGQKNVISGTPDMPEMIHDGEAPKDNKPPQRPEMPQEHTPPEGYVPGENGDRPQPPEGFVPPQRPEGDKKPIIRPDGVGTPEENFSYEFEIFEGSNMFSVYA